MMKNDLDIPLVQWVQAIRSDGVGPRTFWHLLRAHCSIEGVLDFLSTTGKPVFSQAAAEDEIALHAKKGYKILAAFMQDFPQHLRSISDCPPVISVYGRLDCLNKPTFAIVGSRNASILGRQFAEVSAREIAEAGWIIASGLARGVDRHAHIGSLKTGTVAVIAGGIDNIYPHEHADLYHHIPEHGAVISEMPFGTHPGAIHFPRRNRIISGISRGVLVVEATLKSGSLITARFALEQNRDLFAVPGSPFDPRCRGTNELLRQGAILTEESRDVLNALQNRKRCLRESPLDFIPEPSPDDNIPEDIADKILSDLSVTPTPIDLLMKEYGISAQQTQRILQELEVSGNIKTFPNGTVSCVSNDTKS